MLEMAPTKVERLDLDDGRGGEARCGASGRAMASCSKHWPVVACYRLAVASCSLHKLAAASRTWL